MTSAQEIRQIGDYDIVGAGVAQMQAAEQLIRASEFIELAAQVLDSLETP